MESAPPSASATMAAAYTRSAESGGAGGADGAKSTGQLPAARASKRKKISPFWAKQLHLWHWMSSAVCLVGMLLFAFTGITLNHAAEIEAEPAVVTVETQIPAAVLGSLQGATPDDDRALPQPVLGWARDELSLALAGRPVEWSEDEAYVALPRPGGDGWLAIDRASGDVVYERTDRGWIAWLNDLHKGRDTGTAWSWFIDVFSVAAIIFTLTGLILLWLHSRHRRLTWPLVGAGLVLPLLLIILFVHR